MLRAFSDELFLVMSWLERYGIKLIGSEVSLLFVQLSLAELLLSVVNTFSALEVLVRGFGIGSIITWDVLKVCNIISDISFFCFKVQWFAPNRAARNGHCSVGRIFKRRFFNFVVRSLGLSFLGRLLHRYSWLGKDHCSFTFIRTVFIWVVSKNMQLTTSDAFGCKQAGGRRMPIKLSLVALFLRLSHEIFHFPVKVMNIKYVINLIDVWRLFQSYQTQRHALF